MWKEEGSPGAARQGVRMYLIAVYKKQCSSWFAYASIPCCAARRRARQTASSQLHRAIFCDTNAWGFLIAQSPRGGYPSWGYVQRRGTMEPYRDKAATRQGGTKGDSATDGPTMCAASLRCVLRGVRAVWRTARIRTRGGRFRLGSEAFYLSSTRTTG